MARDEYNDWYRTGVQDCGNVFEGAEFEDALEEHGNEGPEAVVDAVLNAEDGWAQESWLEQNEDDLEDEGLDPIKAYESWKAGWRSCAIEHVREMIEDAKRAAVAFRVYDCDQLVDTFTDLDDALDALAKLEKPPTGLLNKVTSGNLAARKGRAHDYDEDGVAYVDYRGMVLPYATSGRNAYWADVKAWLAKRGDHTIKQKIPKINPPFDDWKRTMRGMGGLVNGKVDCRDYTDEELELFVMNEYELFNAVKNGTASQVKAVVDQFFIYTPEQFEQLMYAIQARQGDWKDNPGVRQGDGGECKNCHRRLHWAGRGYNHRPGWVAFEGGVGVDQWEVSPPVCPQTGREHVPADPALAARRNPIGPDLSPVQIARRFDGLVKQGAIDVAQDLLLEHGKTIEDVTWDVSWGSLDVGTFTIKYYVRSSGMNYNWVACVDVFESGEKWPVQGMLYDTEHGAQADALVMAWNIVKDLAAYSVVGDDVSREELRVTLQGPWEDWRSWARYGWPPITPHTPPELLEAKLFKKNPDRVRKNPSPANPQRDKAVAKYKEFWRQEPTKVGEFPSSFKIPTRVHGMGRIIHVLYESLKTDPETLKKPGKPLAYIHEHDWGVHVHDLQGDLDTEVPDFIANAQALVCLGQCLGFKWRDGEGDEHEAEGTDPLPDLWCTVDGRALLVIQSKKKVLQIIWGGSLGVEARGIVH